MDIPDGSEFWVKIKREGFDFNVVEVEGLKDSVPLRNLSKEVTERGEEVTMMKSVQIHMARVQEEGAEISDKNRWCVVNSIMYWC